MAILVTGVRQWRRSHPTEGIVTILIGLVVATFFVLFASAMSQTPYLVDYGGLFQRICVIVGFG